MQNLQRSESQEELEYVCIHLIHFWWRVTGEMWASIALKRFVCLWALPYNILSSPAMTCLGKPWTIFKKNWEKFCGPWVSERLLCCHSLALVCFFCRETTGNPACASKVRYVGYEAGRPVRAIPLMAARALPLGNGTAGSLVTTATADVEKNIRNGLKVFLAVSDAAQQQGAKGASMRYMGSISIDCQERTPPGQNSGFSIFMWYSLNFMVVTFWG